MISPMKKEIKGIESERLLSGCISYYYCLCHTFEEMYDHSEVYHIPVEEIDRALDGTSFRKALVYAMW